MTRLKTISLVVAGFLCAGGVLWALKEVAPPPPRGQASATGPAALGFAGSPSCSARACHGADKPVADINAIAQQNEYTTSLMYDKHTRSYQALLEDRAKRIAENLAPGNPDGKVIPAHRDQRCLACHVTPQAAWDADPGKDLDLPTLNWRLAGVGCEACHGPAVVENKSWMVSHTSKAWSKKTADEKAAFGFIDLSNLTAQAQVCAGCHVGAAPDEKNKIPARDCNHEIMAAGHPRLNFELSVFRDNMPPHWNVHLREKTEHHPKVWLVGRVAAAKASLQMLEHRASQAKKDSENPRWPEFAEYRCFACHSDLNPGWRGAEKEANRTRGSLPYDPWHSTLLAELNDDLKEGYKELAKQMAGPYPAPDAVLRETKGLIGVHNKWLEVLHGQKQIDTAKPLKAAADALQKVPPTWEEATQLTLAVASMKREAAANDPKWKEALLSISNRLSFPDKDEGPRGFDGRPADNAKLKDAFADLLKLIR